MEILSCCVVCMGVLHAINCQYAYDIVSLNLYTLNFVSALCLFACIYDVVFNNLLHVHMRQNVERKISGPCLSYLTLIPVAGVISVLGDETKDDVTVNYWEQLSVVVLTVSLINQLHIAVKDYVQAKGDKRYTWYALVFSPWLTVAVLHAWLMASEIGGWTLLSMYGMTSLAFTLHRVALTDMSSSFSLSESSMIFQALTIYLFKVAGVLSSGSDMEKFINVAVMSAMLVLTLVRLFPLLRGSLMFFGTNVCVAVLVSMPLLKRLTGQFFVFWLLRYIAADPMRGILFLYWCLVCLLSVFMVTCIYNSHFTLHCDEVWPRRSEQRWRNLLINSFKRKRQPVVYVNVKNDPTVSSGLRKVFHLMAILTFVPGLMCDVDLTNCAATCACVVFAMLECARVLKVGLLGEYLEAYLGLFRDRQDQGVFILTPIYLLVGFTLPLWLHPSGTTNTLSLNSGVLALGVGDTFAAVIGSRFGRRKWPQSNRSIEGAAAFVVSTLVATVLLCYTTVQRYQTTTNVLLAVFLTAFLESFTSQIDNLVLPVFMFTLLLC